MMFAKSMVLPLLFACVAIASAQDVDMQANRHLVRGLTAIEIATSDAELALAADEFRKATEIAPGMADAWFNLGQVQARRANFDEAIACFRRYLALAPDAEDAAQVSNEIIKLEFRQELLTKASARAGVWANAKGDLFRLNIDGSRIVLFTDRYAVGDDEVQAGFWFNDNFGVSEKVALVYRLEARQAMLAGTWWRGSILSEQCKVPEDTGDVRGEIRDVDGTLSLRYMRTRYRAVTQPGGLFQPDHCGELSAVEKPEVEVLFWGPLQDGGIGAGLAKGDWRAATRATSPVTVERLEKGGPAAGAGLKNGDVILAIDGWETKDRPLGEVISHLYGEPGSLVALIVQRRKSPEPLAFSITRTRGTWELPTQP